MKLNNICSKVFLKTLFWKQNHHHRHGVFLHTVKVAYHAAKHGDLKFIIPALLHDIGKPFCAYQDEKDKIRGTYSFTNHEELSWYIIRKWPFISDWTKNMVRYHYLIRDMHLSKKNGKLARYNRIHKRWLALDDNLKAELGRFLKYDDLAK